MLCPAAWIFNPATMCLECGHAHAVAPTGQGPGQGGAKAKHDPAEAALDETVTAAHEARPSRSPAEQHSMCMYTVFWRVQDGRECECC